ncbi:MAG: transcription antitermination factor NusB [Rickettsiales bacterium]|nr:transcription antitermination factor NusB [Rickettsiales bacterium]|tara:strand:- start:8526 stop:8927 length:402 start_codon:yes stop_codon:yes gene_type:complete
MGVRRDGREAAVQFLFSKDINNDISLDGYDSFFSLCTAKERAKVFAKELLVGILQNKESIDEKIEAHVDNFQLNRLSAIDRNVLRLAIFEMMHCEDIPPAVCINEAIEISKRFGTEDSGSFVNGVLDKIKSNL